MEVVFIELVLGGRDLQTAPIIQIGAVAVGLPQWRVLEEFERKVRFDEAAGEAEALLRSSYRADAWAHEARTEPVVLGELGAFLIRHATIATPQGAVAQLGGHNLGAVGLPVLASWCSRWHLALPFAAHPLDTSALAVALRVGGHLRSSSLGLTALCKEFQIVSQPPYGPVATAKASAELAQKLLGALQVR